MEIYKRGSRGETVKCIQKALNLYPDGIFGVLTEERVKDYQRQHGLKPDGIVGPATMGKLLPSVVATALNLKKSKRVINEIIVHCSATQEGKDFTVADIRRWHKAQGWSDIGYHYVVYRNGHVELGRDIDIVGAHATDHNAHSIGVCYIGGLASDGKTPKDTRTLAQKAALMSLLMDLRKLYPNAKIYSHRDCRMNNGKLPNKACPSFDATSEYHIL